MVTMVDEIFDRTYQSGRAEFHDGIDRAFARFGRELFKGLDTLNRLQWSAPWARQRRDTGCA